MKQFNNEMKIGLSIIVVLAVTFVGLSMGGGLMKRGDLSSITTYVESENPVKELFNGPVKIIREATEAIGDALFDIILTIPDKSRQIKPNEDLMLSIELINFGSHGKTDVSLAYIITNSYGDVILIEHQDKVIQTQASFIKEIDLPEKLTYGTYKIFIEMLYSNASAIATGEFEVI